ncbi:MAG: hypothetical protein IH914_05165 [candidate division Zixibacteria bacterium]|nr:hypothetical protein [candidate division Zixibacteria bacterium]
MKHVNALLVTVALSSLLLGCGSDSTNPIPVVQTGSNSLLIDADVSGSDAAAGVFVSSFLVSVQDSLGVNVTDAIVTITNGGIGVLTLVHDNLDPGNYKLTRNGYTSGTYVLNIARGTDFVAGVAVVAPDLHTITSPTVNDILFTAAAFTVLWTRITAAEVVTIETRDFGPVLSSSVGDSDDGSFVISSGGTVRDDQRIRVSRKNSTTISVGLTGSSFDAEIRNSVEPIVVQ